VSIATRAADSAPRLQHSACSETGQLLSSQRCPRTFESKPPP